MTEHIVVDSGPLVALFNRDDEHHQKTVDYVRRLRGDPVSNLAVVTEVCYVLQYSSRAQRDFLNWVGTGALALMEIAPPDWARIAAIMDKYADLPADFADASLVALCERLGTRRIMTLDRDFDIYQYRDREPFENLLIRGD